MHHDLSLACRPEEWQGFPPRSEFEFPLLKTLLGSALLHPISETFEGWCVLVSGRWKNECAEAEAGGSQRTVSRG